MHITASCTCSYHEILGETFCCGVMCIQFHGDWKCFAPKAVLHERSHIKLETKLLLQKKKKKVQPRPQRDTASTITHSGNTSSAAAKQSRLSTQIITHLTSVSRLVKCVFSTRPATSVSPRLFGYTTPPRLSLLAFSQSFISPCSPAAGLLSHTVPPEIFIKVSLPGRLLGIHHGRVLQARTQKPPFASSHTPFIETLDEESHLFFLHPSIISSFSSHPSQI